MSDTQTASPEFPEQLGQLAKFYRVMGLKPEEIQVVIDDPESRAIIQRLWQKVCYPPEVKLAAAIFAGCGMSLQRLHQVARRVELAIFLSALHSDEAQVLDLRLGLTRTKSMKVDEVARELGISIEEAQKRHVTALRILSQHIRQRDHEQPTS